MHRVKNRVLSDGCAVAAFFVLLISCLLTFVFLILFFGNISKAVSVDSDFEVTVGEMLELSLVNCDSTNSSMVVVDVVPSTTGAFKSACQTVAVNTNNPGYSLTTKATGTNANYQSGVVTNNLLYQNPTTITPTPAIPTTTNTIATPNTLINDTWGFAAENRLSFDASYIIDNASNIYAELPVTDTIIYSTDQWPITVNSHKFYYATKLTPATMAGTYMTTITYTAVGVEVIDPSLTSPVFNLEYNGYDLLPYGVNAKITFDKTSKLYEPNEQIEFNLLTDGTINKSLVVSIYNNTTDTLVDTKTFSSISQLQDYFTISQNGSYRIVIAVDDNDPLEVNIGVLNPNNRISDPNFYFGFETRLARIYDWSIGAVGLPNLTQEENYNLSLEYIDFSGVNYVRDGSQLKNIYPNESAKNYSSMDRVMPDIASRNITLNWVMAGRHDWFSKEGTYGLVPDQSKIGPLVQDFATRYNSYTNNLIYEVGNEPNLLSFWHGTSTEYLNYLSEISTVIKTVNTNNVVTNGGLVMAVNQVDGLDLNYAPYWSSFTSLNNQNKLDYVSIHGHGSLFNSINAINTIMPTSGFSGSDIIVNEIGYDTSNWDTQAYTGIVKLLYIKTFGYRGYSLYTLIPDHEEPGAYNSITYNAEPKPLYLQYVTAMRFLQNTTYVSHVNTDTTYQGLFNGSTYRVLVCANQTPMIDVSTATVYDAYGNVSPSEPTEIMYYVIPK